MELKLDNLHHSYLVIGEKTLAERAVCEFFEAEGIKTTGSPDFFRWEGESFGVDDARKLSARALQRAFTGRKIFFLAPEKITLEAENALLKTFEEPVPNTHFFLVVRNEELLIPTLRSRMSVVRLQSLSQKDDVEVNSFLNSPLKKRLEFVKRFVEKESNLSAFLDSLLSSLREKGNTSLTREVYKMRLLSDARAASSRLILEHLAVVL